MENSSCITITLATRCSTPITLRDEGVAVDREDIDVPEIVFAGSIDVVTPESYDAGDIGENQTSILVAVVLAGAG